MRLYKCLDEVSGREFLRTGRIKVDCRDGKDGMIFFSPQKLLQDIPADGLMLEFEVFDYSLLDPSPHPRERERTIHVQLSNSERIDAEYWLKLGSYFQLETIYIAPGCQIGWKYARAHLKKMGDARAAVKVLAYEMLTDGSRMGFVVDEQFMPIEPGLRYFKRKLGCPREYNESLIVDVD